MKKIFTIALIIIGLASCEPSQKVTGTWKNPDFQPKANYKKILIMAMTEKQTTKAYVENILTDYLKSKNYEIIRSADVFPPAFLKADIGKELLVAEIKKMNIDAVLTVAVMHEKTTEHYVPGTSAYAPYPFYSYYGSYYGYYSYRYPTVYEPGYYSTEKTYFLETNLYDVDTETLIWSMQSQSYSPANLESFAKGYAALVAYQLKKDGIKKQKP
jgi:hypothetical protein